MKRQVDWYGVIGATVCFTGLMMLIFPEPRKSVLSQPPSAPQTTSHCSASDPVRFPDRTRKTLPARH